MTFKKKTPPVNHNTSYHEYKLDVTTTMRPDGTGGEKLRHHIGEFGKLIKTVRIEPRRANDLNRCWESRRIFYLEEGKTVPDSIKRSPGEDENGDFKWNDVVIPVKTTDSRTGESTDHTIS